MGIFPGWKPSTAGSCEVCEEALESHQGDQKALGDRQKKEKVRGFLPSRRQKMKTDPPFFPVPLFRERTVEA